jgi:hypothetical protein
LQRKKQRKRGSRKRIRKAKKGKYERPKRGKDQ